DGMRWVLKKKEAEHALTIAKKEAEDANAAKGAFIANLSHEIRTPMNAIIGLNHLLGKTGLDIKQSDYVNKIAKSANTLLELLNAILDASKIEAGRIVLERREFLLHDVMAKTINMISSKARSKSLELFFEIEQDVPNRILGDSLRLSQILFNLVSNAVKFTQHGHVRIYVKKINEDDNGATLKFVVSDTGIGITNEQKKKLFKAFSQADDSTTRKYGGTGLGLNISKGLVEIMGGEISVTSKFGEGSSFEFVLRFDLVDNDERISIIQPGNLENLKILVVDDNKMVRRAISRLLARYGSVVNQAQSGEEAIAEIKNSDLTSASSYDLVFIDWTMPGMNGGEVTKALKDNDQSISKIPKVIVMSAYMEQDEIAENAMLFGADGYITKPVTPSVLLNSIMNVLFKDGDNLKRVSVIPEELLNEEMLSVRGARLLLAEDNEINQQVAKELLQSQDFIVDVVSDGSQAVEAVLKKPDEYDAVLMDIHMPVMDGYEATRIIRSDSRFADLPIIAMTANVSVEDKERAVECGMNEHVAKPIEPLNLFEVLLRCIKQDGRGFNFRETRSTSDLNLRSRETIIAAAPKKIKSYISDLSGLLDIQKGVERIGGNEEAFFKLLEKYVLRQADAVDEIVFSLAAGDLKEAIEHVHTLKGVSGNVGAVKVSELAAQAEQSLKTDDGLNYNFTPLRLVLNDTCKVIQTKITEFQRSVQLSEQTIHDINIELDKLLVHIDEIESLLVENDSLAVKKINQLFSRIPLDEIEPVFNNFYTEINSYEFDKALNTLQIIKQRI
ncbi:MAG: response regulator, partial [Deltaproteobacteria bacterium]|nr:response regulator [Deltaproteobacteria bacterium]